MRVRDPRNGGVLLLVLVDRAFSTVTRPYPDSTCTCERIRDSAGATGAELARMLGHAAYLLVALLLWHLAS